MIIKELTKDRLFKLNELFDKHEWSHWAENCLSTYLVEAVSEDDKVIAIGSCYFAEGCDVTFLGFFIADRDFDKETRSTALDLIIKNIYNEANKRKKYMITYSTDSKSMTERMERHGMKCTDRGTGYILIQSLVGQDTGFFEE